MYLKSLELSGFKSFAKKETLEFKSAITAIVGPNGSGKSNTAEAFRFVLGEQSLKSMRGKRGEDLIWSGSKLFPKGNRASVKVIFDNTSRLLNVDHEEVTFERVVHRDGVNEYFINGSSVRLKDVAELLAHANIGASGHHIISQGEADRILSTNARERREMIEDALGLKVYQYKRVESEKKLVKTKENIESVQSLRREIAPHIKFLKKQMERIERVKEMRATLISKYAEYLKRESLYLTIEKEKIEAEKAPLLTEKEELQQKISDIKNKLASEKTETNESNRLISIETGLRDLRLQKETHLKTIGRVEGTVEALKREHERRLKEIESSGGVVPFEEVRELSLFVHTAVDQGMLEGDISAVKSALSKIKEALRNFFKKHEQTEHRNDLEKTFNESIQQISDEKTSAENALAKLNQEEKDLLSELEVLKNAISKNEHENRDAERSLFELMNRMNELAIVISNLSQRESIRDKEYSEFNRECQEGAVLVGRSIKDYEQYDVSPEEVAHEDRLAQEERRRELEKLKIRIEDTGAGDSEDVEKEYKEASERDAFLAKEIEDLERSAESLSTLINELALKIETEFTEGVKKINNAFNSFFTLMFGGGRAGIHTVVQKKRVKKKSEIDEVFDMDEENETEKKNDVGIDVDVSLPHKRTKGLMMLSGGERALTSIALLFAISQVNPPPFIILDETDAALDEANSRKYGDMIESLSSHSQLILITHNRETMSRAGILYGVTMAGDGSSKLLSVRFEDAVATAK
ncbi:MAG: AAA family ATPase [Candidatus Paceibacterota bacterium]